LVEAPDVGEAGVVRQPVRNDALSKAIPKSRRVEMAVMQFRTSDVWNRLQEAQKVFNGSKQRVTETNNSLLSVTSVCSR
jgi:hypothetical protein